MLFIHVNSPSVNLFITFPCKLLFVFNDHKLNYRFHQIVLYEGDTLMCWYVGPVDHSEIYLLYIQNMFVSGSWETLLQIGC